MLRRHRVTAAILAVISLVGCGSNAAQTRASGKIAGSFEELLDFKLSRSDLNDFEREAYMRAKETGRIAQADYDEAYARYADCMSERGDPVTLKKLPNGLYQEKAAPLKPGQSLEQSMDIVSACQKITVGYLPEMFAFQQGNPELLRDMDEAAYRCLERSSLVPEGYSLEQFSKSMNEPEPGGGSRLNDMPFDFKSDDVQACLVGAGIALGVVD
ncbi:hypothetical protein SPF06_03020 [Sinomonas sp. JGH33]|uniref:Lipoprotein n=1 Tax=Sinomonas terricola TaxID=3110330 RepID=A0ABU5T210_9MICC|nr:hypothetical protein [Sinomonas sp. JGH33]MEA5453684.1 hypothetical protein [Sinomonas sp. JGH33]